MNILLTDGAVKVTFEPALDAVHYADLLYVAQTVKGVDSLRQTLEHRAVLWGVVGFSMETA